MRMRMTMTTSTTKATRKVKSPLARLAASTAPLTAESRRRSLCLYLFSSMKVTRAAIVACVLSSLFASASSASSASSSCCIAASDCTSSTVSYPHNSKPPPETCGNVNCVDGTCVFVPLVNSGLCGREYTARCSGYDNDMCAGGPDLGGTMAAAAAGACDQGSGRGCTYRWCPEAWLAVVGGGNEPTAPRAEACSVAIERRSYGGAVEGRVRRRGLGEKGGRMWAAANDDDNDDDDDNDKGVARRRHGGRTHSSRRRRRSLGLLDDRKLRKPPRWNEGGTADGLTRQKQQPASSSSSTTTTRASSPPPPRDITTMIHRTDLVYSSNTGHSYAQVDVYNVFFASDADVADMVFLIAGPPDDDDVGGGGDTGGTMDTSQSYFCDAREDVEYMDLVGTFRLRCRQENDANGTKDRARMKIMAMTRRQYQDQFESYIQPGYCHLADFFHLSYDVAIDCDSGCDGEKLVLEIEADAEDDDERAAVATATFTITTRPMEVTTTTTAEERPPQQQQQQQQQQVETAVATLAPPPGKAGLSNAIGGVSGTSDGNGSGGMDWYRPSPQTTWDFQLYGPDFTFGRRGIDDNINLYVVDLFDQSADSIRSIQLSSPTRRKWVSCHLSAGTYENWRPDAALYPESVKGAVAHGYDDENWIDLRASDVIHPLLLARLDLAASKGCDAVDVGNVDAYDVESHEYTGFDITFDEQLAFNRWLASEAHARGLGVGLHGDPGQASDLEPDFDFALAEGCVQYGECDSYDAFVSAGKAMFLYEFELETDEFCPEANFRKIVGIKKRENLGQEYDACPPWWTSDGQKFVGQTVPTQPPYVRPVTADVMLSLALDANEGYAGTLITAKAGSPFGSFGSWTMMDDANADTNGNGGGEEGAAIVSAAGVGGDDGGWAGGRRGGKGGRVYWNGVEGIVTFWSDSEVRFYVPETAYLGEGYVTIVTADDRASPSELFTLLPNPWLAGDGGGGGGGSALEPIRLAYRFVHDKLVDDEDEDDDGGSGGGGDGGVRTNLLDKTEGEDVYLHGHHVTSENMGLWMYASASLWDHASYERSYRYVSTYMMDSTHDVVNWGIDKRDGEPFVYDYPGRDEHYNSPLDDFRIVGALIVGYTRWKDVRYRDLAIRIGEGLYRTSVCRDVSPDLYPNGLVSTGFGWEVKEEKEVGAEGEGGTSPSPPLSYTECAIVPVHYGDLWAMRWLSENGVPEWDGVYGETTRLMEDAQLPSGHFYNTFDRETQSFRGDFEYQDEEEEAGSGGGRRMDKIRTAQSLWTAIHLARVGRVGAARMAFDFYSGWYDEYGSIPDYFNADGTEATDLDGPVLAQGATVRTYSLFARLCYYLVEQQEQGNGGGEGDGYIDRSYCDSIVTDTIEAAQDTDPESTTYGHLSSFGNGVDSEAYETLEGLLTLSLKQGSDAVGMVYYVDS